MNLLAQHPTASVVFGTLALCDLAAVPHGTYVECFADPERDPVWQSLWVNRPPIEDGLMAVTDEPGVGLVLDDAMIRRYRAG